MGTKVSITGVEKSFKSNNKLQLIFNPTMQQCIDCIQDVITSSTCGDFRFYYCDHGGFECAF